mmetsp:Transcript_11850/g.41547  ORF Transcript_11850/g.41547 Transcript_11850/m.41547 type:complete len:366 (-) Transcript_11850:266-1363(-)
MGIPRVAAAVLALVLSTSSVITASGPPPQTDASVRISAPSGASSLLHLLSTDAEGAEEGAFSFIRSPPVAGDGDGDGDGDDDVAASLHLMRDDKEVLSVDGNGTVTVHTDLHVAGHGSLTGSLAGHNATAEAMRQYLAVIDGVVSEHDAAVLEHGRHFDSFLSVLNFVSYKFPHAGVEKEGRFTFTGRKAFHAQHTESHTGTRKVALATIRNIVGHWGSISIEATLHSAYYNGGVSKYAGYWNYCGTGNVGCVGLTKTHGVGTEHGSLELVDTGKTYAHPSNSQNDVYEKSIVLSVVDYATVQVELTITTTYGHMFASSRDYTAARAQQAAESVAVHWLQWGSGYDDDANHNDYLALQPNLGPGT